MARDINTLLRDLIKQGAQVTRARNGHIRVVNPGNGRQCQISATPSDNRSINNIITRLRRIGLMERHQPEQISSGPTLTSQRKERTR